MNAIGGPASAPTAPSPLRPITLVEGNRQLIRVAACYYSLFAVADRRLHRLPHCQCVIMCTACRMR